MFREIAINSDPHETRVALLEDRELTEILVERADRPHTVGDIYKGRINAVLPGMQAAFVEVGMAKKDFVGDVKHLIKLWTKIEKKAEIAKSPALVHSEEEMSIGLIRDLFTEDTNQVTVDSKEVYEEVMDYLKNFTPELRSRIKLYKGDKPIFDHFGIEAEIERLMQRKVWLNKGGYLTIDQAEALVAIDVNTGRFTGRKNQDDTIFKTNMEAAREV